MTSNKNSHLVFPKFEDIQVSTKTFISMTNLTIDLRKLFDFLPVTDYIVIPKRRGRKKNVTILIQIQIFFLDLLLR